MESQNNQTEQNEAEIDLLDLLRYLKKKLWIIILALLICAVGGFVFTRFFMDTEYTATTQMYVLSRTNEDNVAYSDFQISNQLIEDYKVLLTGESVYKDVIRNLGLNMTAKELGEKVAVTVKDSTRVLQISVTDTDPKRAAEIANALFEVGGQQIQTVTQAEAVNLVYAAEIPQSPSGPNVMKNTLIAAVMGAVIAIAVLVVIYLLDDTIRTEEDVEKYLGLSTLGVLPVSAEFESMSSKSASGSSGSKKTSRGSSQAKK